MSKADDFRYADEAPSFRPALVRLDVALDVRDLRISVLLRASFHLSRAKAATEAVERAGFMQFLWMPITST